MYKPLVMERTRHGVPVSISPTVSTHQAAATVAARQREIKRKGTTQGGSCPVPPPLQRDAETCGCGFNTN
jgi:hypothetical protein